MADIYIILCSKLKCWLMVRTVELYIYHHIPIYLQDNIICCIAWWSCINRVCLSHCMSVCIYVSASLFVCLCLSVCLPLPIPIRAFASNSATESDTLPFPLSRVSVSWATRPCLETRHAMGCLRGGNTGCGMFVCWCDLFICYVQWPLLLTWFTFNPSMDK